MHKIALKITKDFENKSFLENLYVGLCMFG